MNKQIFITNGMARCGKDTFAILLNEIVPTLKYSSIHEVKRIAEYCGWAGRKTEKDRKFLSDLKMIISEYSDLPFLATKEKIDEFLLDKKYSVLLIDIREPKEIERTKTAFNAKTILIENNRVNYINSNTSDSNVFDYSYDFIIHNNGTMDEFRNNVYEFACAEILKNA